MIIKVVINMKKLLKDSYLLLIFFMIFLFKESIYGLLIKTNDVYNINTYINNTKESYYEKEYKQISKIINLENNSNYNYQYTKIIYRDIYEFYDELTILKGSNDNIHKNSAVINESGLIGTIKKVNKNSSIVTLITNKDSNVSIRVNKSYGILKSLKNKIIITSINNHEDIEVGNIVYTSGLGNLPKGIKVGEVESVTTHNLGIEKEIIVKPYVNFDNIDYVAVFDGDEL